MAGLCIFATTQDGVMVTLNIRTSETVAAMKLKLEEKLGCSLNEQTLMLSGESLDDNLTVEEYQIEDKSVINVVARLRGGIQIFAKTMDGKIVPIEGMKNETIGAMKRKIHEKIGLAPDEQKLVFQGIILEEDKTVEEYQITDQSVINVVARLRSGMQIFAKTMDGKIVPIEVMKNERIATIKKMIQDKIGLAPDEQKLVFQGGLLEEDVTVEEYQIADKSVINVVVRPRIDITIRDTTTDGQTVSISVMSYWTIAQVKSKIQENLIWSPDEQQLEFQEEILENKKFVDDYAIVNDSVINLVRYSIEIFALGIYGRNLSFLIVGSEKILALKTKIQEQTGLLPDEQELMFQGQILEDEKTAEDYQIVDKSEINVVRVPIQIFALGIYGRNLPFLIVRNEKISALKMKIQEQTGLPQDEQELLFLGQILEDEKMMEDYQIGNKSEIKVEKRLKLKIKIVGQDAPVEIYGDPKRRAGDLKTMLDQAEVAEQRLYFKRKLMDDELALGHYKIKSGDTIEMFRMSSVKVRVRDGASFVAVIEVNKNKSVSDMKSLIERKLDLAPNRLSLDYNGKKLIDDHSVRSCGIQNMEYVAIFREAS